MQDPEVCGGVSSGDGTWRPLHEYQRRPHTLKLTLEELEYPQMAISIHCNNATVVGITNGTIKQQRP